MALDRIAAETGIVLDELQFDALTGRGSWCGHETLLAKPLSFMNRSGAAIKSIAEAFALQSEDIIILHDDMDFHFGAIRIKTRGGSGGHRGVASIREHLCTDLFVRLRIGIGRPPEALAGSDYVLDRFSDTELRKIAPITGLVLRCLEMLLTQGISEAMNRFHTTVLLADGSGTEPAKA